MVELNFPRIESADLISPVLAAERVNASRARQDLTREAVLASQFQRQQEVDAAARRQQVRGLAGGIATGDRGAITQAASLDPQALSNISQAIAQADGVQLQRMAAENDRLGRLAIAADTPEKWAQAATQAGRPDLANRFDQREAIISQAVSIEQQLAQRERETQRQFTAEQNQLNRQAAFATTAARLSQPQSKAGKLLADIELFRQQFGDNSPQVRALQEAADSEASGEPPKLTDIAGLRKEFTKLAGPFIKIRDSFEKVKLGAANASAAGDVGMIFNFMKMLDPGSVVREGEFATAASAAGMSERIIGIARRVDSGERLTPNQRQDFLNVAEGIFVGQQQAQRRLEDEFARIATAQNMPVNEVIIDFNPVQQPQPARSVDTPTEGRPFAEMTAAELRAVDIDSIPDDRLDEFNAAMDAQNRLLENAITR